MLTSYASANQYNAYGCGFILFSEPGLLFLYYIFDFIICILWSFFVPQTWEPPGPSAKDIYINTSTNRRPSLDQWAWMGANWMVSARALLLSPVQVKMAFFPVTKGSLSRMCTAALAFSRVPRALWAIKVNYCSVWCHPSGCSVTTHVGLLQVGKRVNPTVPDCWDSRLCHEVKVILF